MSRHRHPVADWGDGLVTERIDWRDAVYRVFRWSPAAASSTGHGAVGSVDPVRRLVRHGLTYDATSFWVRRTPGRHRFLVYQDPSEPDLEAALLAECPTLRGAVGLVRSQLAAGAARGSRC